ncbi:MAG TPA: VanZ family protein, partial [Luteitalea sp.]|nr:VanZ family protein [Luteitalea sp.]
MNGGRWLRVATLLAYAAFLAYQSLGSGAEWRCSGSVLSLHTRISRTDLLANVVAYIPLGLLGVLAAASTTTSRRRIAGYGVAVLAGAASFSTTMEWLQACQPGRVSSLLDVVANTAGSASGVVGGFAMESLALARAMRTPGLLVVPSADEYEARRLWLLTVAIGLVWLASQTVPWTFSVDLGTFRANLSFLRRWNGVDSLDGWRVLRHCGAWVALVCVGHLATRRRAQAATAVATLCGASLGLQLMLSARAPLSFEELAGMTLALVLIAPLLLIED